MDLTETNWLAEQNNMSDAGVDTPSVLRPVSTESLPDRMRAGSPSTSGTSEPRAGHGLSGSKQIAGEAEPVDPEVPNSATSQVSDASVWTRASSILDADDPPRDEDFTEDNTAYIPLQQTYERKTIRTRRNARQTALRNALLYLVPAGLALPISLLLHLCTTLVRPIYGPLPLSLHRQAIYTTDTIPVIFVLSLATLRGDLNSMISARVCLCVSAIGGDFIAVAGRKVANHLAGRFGPETGAVVVQSIFGVAVFSGGAGFAVLCWEYVLSPSSMPPKGKKPAVVLLSIVLRVALFAAHIWGGQKMWVAVLSGGTSAVERHPEKSILFVTFFLTALALLLRPQDDGASIPRSLHSALDSHFKLTPRTSKQLWDILAFLPKQMFPVILLLRVPLLVLALKQQLFLRPMVPYLTEGGDLRILFSEPSTTGHIVVGEHLAGGYRFLRRDAEILGGRWSRQIRAIDGQERVELGDSIFGRGPLPEVGYLAVQTGTNDSLAKTIALTTGLQIALEADDSDTNVSADDSGVTALIIGVSTGQSALSFIKRGLAVDIVEPDPAILHAATSYFQLKVPDDSTLNVMHGATFMRSLSDLTGENSTTVEPMWRYAIVDLMAQGGTIDVRMATCRFWEEVKAAMTSDGVLAVSLAFIRGSAISRSVIITLQTVFANCRAFGDGSETEGVAGMSNMVVICSMDDASLLTFRRPKRSDVLKSPLRSHVFSTFLAHEIQLDSLYAPEDLLNPRLILTEDEEMSVSVTTGQREAARSAWSASRQILPHKFWEAY